MRRAFYELPRSIVEKPDYKDQVIEIMQEPKQYILKLEGETDNEQH